MDTTTQPLHIPIPQPDVTPTPVQPHEFVPKQPMKPEIIAAIVAIILGAIFLIGMKFLGSRKPTMPIVVEKTLPTPTPTPTRLLSSLATQSAFLKLETNVASLSAAISNYVVDDPSLSPPALELPLGFQ